MFKGLTTTVDGLSSMLRPGRFLSSESLPYPQNKVMVVTQNQSGSAGKEACFPAGNQDVSSDVHPVF